MSDVPCANFSCKLQQLINQPSPTSPHHPKTKLDVAPYFRDRIQERMPGVGRSDFAYLILNFILAPHPPTPSPNPTNVAPIKEKKITGNPPWPSLDILIAWIIAMKDSATSPESLAPHLSWRGAKNWLEILYPNLTASSGLNVLAMVNWKQNSWQNWRKKYMLG